MGMWADSIKKGAIQAFVREAVTSIGIPGLVVSLLISGFTALVHYWSELKPITAFVYGLLTFATVLVIIVLVHWLVVFYKNKNVSQDQSQYIDLSFASREIYGRLRQEDNAFAREADRNFRGDELNYFAEAISQYIPIYGKHPPSNEIEQLRPAILGFGHFHDNGDAFHYHGNPAPEFVECCVKEPDIEIAIAEMQNIEER